MNMPFVDMCLLRFSVPSKQGESNAKTTAAKVDDGLTRSVKVCGKGYV